MAKARNTEVEEEVVNDVETTESTQPEELKELSKEETEAISGKDEVKFQSNGKSRHMPEDEVYVITTEMAELFLKRGYGKVIK